ncbi:MAG: hypothetical protein PVJ27_02080 [Candidatus Brocadiaceae bacterium]
MKPLIDQLAHAYSREEELYEQVLDLVNEQHRAMDADEGPAAVLDLCRRVEGVMAEIEQIERAIEPAKRAWEETRQDPDGKLDAILGSVEQCIDRITRRQQSVQEKLLKYLQANRESTDEARASINARKADKLYRAG